LSSAHSKWGPAYTATYDAHLSKKCISNWSQDFSAESRQNPVLPSQFVENLMLRQYICFNCKPYESIKVSMDAIDNLRNDIKSYFPESSELQLSSYFAKHRRFNFYFKITDDYRFLLYLNWDEGDRFTLKCLEFNDTEILNKLIDAYPETGSKAFNIGKPRSTAAFIFRGENRLSVTDLKGSVDINFDWNEISGKKLMQCVDPAFAG
jgi:hypothetical protein